MICKERSYFPLRLRLDTACRTLVHMCVCVCVRERERERERESCPLISETVRNFIRMVSSLHVVYTNAEASYRPCFSLSHFPLHFKKSQEITSN